MHAALGELQLGVGPTSEVESAAQSVRETAHLSLKCLQSSIGKIRAEQRPSARDATCSFKHEQDKSGVGLAEVQPSTLLKDKNRLFRQTLDPTKFN